MRFIASILYCSLAAALLTACDKEMPIQDRLIGTWEIQQAGMSGTLALHPDASYIGITNEGTLSGVWKVDENRLIGSVTQSTIPAIDVGFAWSSIIVEVSSTKLALRTRAGDIEEYRRER